jgi:hypothetical protein
MEKRKLTCWEFVLINSTSQKIWKNRTKIITAFKHNEWRISDFESLNIVTLVRRCVRWFQQERSEKNVPMSSLLLMIIFVLSKLTLNEFLCMNLYGS